jgi:CHAT domain-containing protein
MVAFYVELEAGKSPAVALRQAKRQLAGAGVPEQIQSAYRWARFILVGTGGEP